MSNIGRLQEYHDALTRLDELSLTLGRVLQLSRIGWDNSTTGEEVLEPINRIAKLIGEAMPQSIKTSRIRQINYVE